MIGRLWNRLQARYAPEAYCRRIGIRLGRQCRLININPATFGSEPYLITIGDRVTITNGVQFVTHDGGVWAFRDEIPDLDVVRPITIGNDVFIGLRAIVLPGAVIGSRVVIGAGAVVRGIIPDGCVVAGVPARRICSIEEYRAKAMQHGVHTKGLGESEKRRVLEAHFFPKDSSGKRT